MDAVLAESPPTCRDLERWLGPYVDGECAPEDAAAIEDHVRECPACAAELRLLDRTKHHLRASADSLRAPASLVSRIEADIVATRKPRAPLVAAGIFAVAAGCGLLVFTLASGDATPVAPSSSSDFVERAVALHHADLPLDVASPDAVHVGRFLSPRVGAHISVPELSRQGFLLRGARLVTVDERPGALVVFADANGERMTLTVRPGFVPHQMPTPADVSARQGKLNVHVLHQQAGSFAFVGSANADALARAANALAR